MYLLNENQYRRVLPLLKNIKHNRALIYSLVEGNSLGKILVDNTEEPTVAFIENEFTYLVGDEDNIEFNNRICEYIFHDMMSNSKDKELVLFLSTEGWLDMKKRLADRGCITIERKAFTFNPVMFTTLKNKDYDLPESYQLREIDLTVADSYDKYKDMVTSPRKFGFCLTDGRAVISECTSVAVGAGEAEIHIWTDESYRQKGYATLVAQAFINHCLKHNLMPIWSCWPFRKESIMLAKKLGFIEEKNMPALYWSENM